MQALLKDVDMSLLNYKGRPPPPPKELEALETREHTLEEDPEEFFEEPTSMNRKSPAALFGSEGVGAVILPEELRAAVTSIIDCASSSLPLILACLIGLHLSSL